MCGLHDVEPLGAGLEGKEKDINVRAGLEGGQESLERELVLVEVVRDVVALEGLRNMA